MATRNNYFIHNAFVVSGGKVFRADVLVQGGRIAKVIKVGAAVKDLEMADNTVFIDATDKYLLPGVIDCYGQVFIAGRDRCTCSFPRTGLDAQRRYVHRKSGGGGRRRNFRNGHAQCDAANHNAGSLQRTFPFG